MTKAELLEQEISSTWNITDDLKGKSYDEIWKEVQRDRLDFSVMVINVSGNLNVGNILRTSVGLGAKRFIIFGKSGYDHRSTVGAHNYFPVGVFPTGPIDSEDATVAFRCIINDNHLLPIFLETGGEPYKNMDWKWWSLWRAFNYGLEPCIVVGSESTGIPQNILNALNYKVHVSIPMRRPLRSLNVSSAFAIFTSYFVSEVFDA